MGKAERHKGSGAGVQRGEKIYKKSRKGAFSGGKKPVSALFFIPEDEDRRGKTGDCDENAEKPPYRGEEIVHGRSGSGSDRGRILLTARMKGLKDEKRRFLAVSS